MSIIIRWSVKDFWDVLKNYVYNHHWGFIDEHFNCIYRMCSGYCIAVTIWKIKKKGKDEQKRNLIRQNLYNYTISGSWKDISTSAKLSVKNSIQLVLKFQKVCSSLAWVTYIPHAIDVWNNFPFNLQCFSFKEKILLLWTLRVNSWWMFA